MRFRRASADEGARRAIACAASAMAAAFPAAADFTAGHLGVSMSDGSHDRLLSAHALRLPHRRPGRAVAHATAVVAAAIAVAADAPVAAAVNAWAQRERLQGARGRVRVQ